MFTCVNKCDDMKTTPLSVRVDDDDAEFLARLEIDDARTPSEKLRALLHAERRRREGAGDAVQAAEMFRDMLAAAKRRVRRLEAQSGVRSDFMTKFYDRAPDIAGAAFAGPEEKEKDPENALRNFENEQLDGVFAFILEVLELGLTSRNRCYDPAGIEKRMAPLLEILELINMSKQIRKGDD